MSLLASGSRNLCVVGDDDQSIYKFRGADIRNILDFEKEFTDCMTIKLEENYRSTGNILNAANHVIANNTGRKGKELWTSNGEGDKIQIYTALNEHSEAQFIADKITENGGLFFGYGYPLSYERNVTYSRGYAYAVGNPLSRTRRS